MSATRIIFGVPLILFPLKSPLPAHVPLTWQAIHGVRQSFIYADHATLVCAVREQSTPKVARANADFIVCACNHHYELLRLVKAAACILSDACDEHAWPGLGVSSFLAQEFCRQATEILHTAHKPRT